MLFTSVRLNLCAACWWQRAARTGRRTIGKLAFDRKKTVRLSYSSFQPTNKLIEGSPLLVIHGLFGSKRNWDSLAKAISTKAGRKVITVDTRNHGESPHVPEMDYLLMSYDIQALMEDLDIEKAIMLGHSMGGKIAMTLALTQPSLVDKLIVEDVVPNVSRHVGSTAFPVYIEAMKRINFDNTLPSIVEARRFIDEQLQFIFPEREIRDFVLTNVEEGDNGYRWKVNLNSIGDNLQSIVAFPEIDNSYYGDALFIAGETSDHIRESDYMTIRELFPEARIETIREAGHWVHVDQPHLFLKMVLDFIVATS